MTFVKICGVTSEADLRLSVATGADRLGFVVEYPADVPWNLDRHQAARLIAQVPASVSAVAVVGGDAATILELIDRTRAGMVQLHGDEDLATVRAVAASGLPVIKALRAEVGDLVGDPAGWIATARAFADAGAREILVDSRSAARAAGTGVPFDWDLAAAMAAQLPVPLVLAGGLTPGNVADALARVRPAGVDVISGVEGPGHSKDPALVERFVAAVRAVDNAA